MKTMLRAAAMLLVAVGLAAFSDGASEAVGVGPSSTCAPYDVVMMLDASASRDKFSLAKRIALTIGDEFDIGFASSKDRVTALSFSDKAYKRKQLWQVKNIGNLQSLIKSMSTTRSTETNLPFAIDVAREMLNKRPRGATEIIILISDGNVGVKHFSKKFVGNVCSNIGRVDDLSPEAIRECVYTQLVDVVDEDGMKVIYVPIGDSPALPSAPLDAYITVPSDLTDESTIASGVAELACDVGAAATPIGCGDPIDILFVVDASFTIDDEELGEAHDFVLDFASRWAGDARFGLIEYSTAINEIFPLVNGDGSTYFSSSAELEAALEGIIRTPEQRENTNMPLGLLTALNMIKETKKIDAVSTRSTLVVHVGDDAPNVEWEYGRLPVSCANDDNERKYPTKAARACTRWLVKQIRQVAEYVSVRTGNAQGSASLYRNLGLTVDVYKVEDYASWNALADQFVDDQCETSLLGITPSPTSAPTDAPTEAPTDAPTSAPTDAPTEAPTDAPTDAPTEAPTLSPVVFIEGCYEPYVVNKARAQHRLGSFEDEAGIQLPEQCHSKCVETEGCNYWSFRAQSSWEGENAAAQCNLMSELREAVSTSSKRWTSGSKLCTVAPTNVPTEAPTDAPTNTPTNAPTHTPTDAPTDAPTLTPTDTPTDAPTNVPLPDTVPSCWAFVQYQFGDYASALIRSFASGADMTAIDCQVACRDREDCVFAVFDDDYWCDLYNTVLDLSPLSDPTSVSDVAGLPTC